MKKFVKVSIVIYKNFRLEDFSLRASTTGFPQRRSIGPMKMYTTPKKKNLESCFRMERREKYQIPKWKRFLHKDK